MHQPRQFDTARQAIKLATIGLFISLLWLPNLEALFHWDDVPQVSEKRALARLPCLQPGLSGLRTFVGGLEAFYNDHFGFRKRLVYWGQRWRKAWFQESPLPTVMIGRDGWLFYSVDQTLEDIRATTLFKPAQLQAWRSLLECRRDWLARSGIRYLLVIAPDKHTIYPEKLPAWIHQVGPTTKLDQFMTYMKAHSTVPVLDLRPALRRAKQHAVTYLIADTHWNQYGAFVGYQELIRTLSCQLPGLEPLPLSAFSTSTNTESGGDLAAMLAEATTLENNCPVLQPRPPLVPLRPAADKADSRWLTTENPDRIGRAVLFRDSFSQRWVPLIGYHFNKVIYCWHYHWNRQLIEKEQPNVVIDELNEHFFYQQEPDKLKLADALDDPPLPPTRTAAVPMTR